MNIIKSIGAVVAGFITVALLSVATDAILHKTGIMPYGTNISNGMLAVALAYRTLFTVLGGYVTARLAPSSPMKHAMVLLVLGVIAGSAGAIANADLGPAWYAWGIVVLSIPAIWLGAKMVKFPQPITQTTM